MIKTWRTSDDLIIEDSAAGYLDIDFRKQADESLQLRQDGSMDRILALLHGWATPTEIGTMGLDANGDCFSET
jgi:hypothetical protein